MSSNEHITDDLDAFLFDALPSETVREVEQHLETCESCQVELAQARERYRQLKSLPAVEASADLIQRTEDRIVRAERQSTRYAWMNWWLARTNWERVWLGVAVGFLLLLVPTIYFTTLEPSPYDIQVYGQTEWTAGREAALRVIAINRHTNQPVEGMSIRLNLVDDESQKEIELAEFETDSQGTGQPRFSVPKGFGEKCRLRVTGKRWGSDPKIERLVNVQQRLHRVIVNTDKPLYQPGQTIHARGLALSRTDGKPVAGEEAVFTVHDPKGNRILRRRSTSSRFGIASVDCPLATELIEGEYRIECQIGGSSTETRVEVKPYRLPKLRATLKLDRPFYTPGDSIRGEIFATYIHDQPIVDGEVEVTLHGSELQQSTVRTNAEGRAEFEFRVPDGFDGKLSMTGVVEDAAGQQCTFSAWTRISQDPLAVHVIPEAGELVPGIANKVFLMATTADKQSARTELAITGFEKPIETNSLGVAVVEITPKSGSVQWEVTASHKTWRPVTKTIELPVRDRGGADFLVRTDRTVYQGGEEVSISVLSARNTPIYFDLIHEGQTILTGSVRLSQGEGRTTVRLPDRISGPVKVYAYRLQGERIASRQAKQLFVRSGKGLTVRAQPERNEYRPGETAQMKFTLLDAKGRPVPGAISLSIVDEAVYAMAGNVFQPERLSESEQTRQLQGRLGEYASWSPRERASKDQQLWEQALFSTLVNRGGDPREQLKQQLLPLLDNDERLFDVLDRPDWEKMISPDLLPEEAVELLRGKGAIHSLHASSYGQEANLIKARKRQGQEVMKSLWFLFGMATVFTSLVWLTDSNRHLGCFIALCFSFVFVLSLLTPAVQSAREAARRSTARNNLKQIGMALYNFRDQHGEFPTLKEATHSSEPGPRVREWFPETLLWQPELITDKNGQAALEVPLADSITTWRISGGAVSGEGELGGFESSLRAFQPFFVDANLPLELTQGDQITVPVVVSNYLDEPQTVSVHLVDADWFSCKTPATQSVALPPNAVRSVPFPLKILKGGPHALQITATSGELKDAIRRQVLVNYGGRRIEHTASGTLGETQNVAFTIPQNTIPGSQQILVKIYPSPFSQTVEGLEGILKRPYGCFEQTSSTLYPNVLVLDYLRRTKQSRPAIEQKATAFIQTGYQRLLSFEVAGGGFDWFGHPPAHQTLTAYGLTEFEDMASVYDVDPALIDRTRNWLLKKQQADGSWSAESHRLHDDPTRGTVDARLATTAYIGWAVFRNQRSLTQAHLTEAYLTQHRPVKIQDPYVLALMSNALLAITPDGSTAKPYLDRLVSLQSRSRDGKRVWWSPAKQTIFYGTATAADVETTAVATLAILSADPDPALVRSSIAWLIEQKDPHGTWHTTQATILALKALLSASGKPLGGELPSHIEIAVDGQTVRTLGIPAQDSDLMQQFVLATQHAPGPHAITLKETSGTAPAYQVVVRSHVMETRIEPPAEKNLSLAVNYSAKKLQVGQTVDVDVEVIVKNPNQTKLPMVVVELPIPPGFELDPSRLQRERDGRRLAKYEIQGSRCNVYLRELSPGKSQTISYQLKAVLPGILQSPAVKAYPYYAPEQTTEMGKVTLTVEQ